MNLVADLEALLARKRALQGRLAGDAVLRAKLEALRVWQATRLSQTYADLRANPRYAAATEFFLSDVYGARTAQRDDDLERAWRYLKKALPAPVLTVLHQAVLLNVLSEELDVALAEQMSAESIDETTYASIYRRVGRQQDRQRQIDLLIEVGTNLDRIVKHTWIGVALRAAHFPAHAAGCGVLQDFLERGYAAFKGMRGAAEFLATIRERETRLLDALYDADRDPFATCLR